MKEFSSILTTDSSAFRPRVCLLKRLRIGLSLLVVKKVIVYFPMSLLLENISLPRRRCTPYGKIFYQILWGCKNVKATQSCSSRPIKKKREEGKRRHNGLTATQTSLNRPSFPFRSAFKTEILTLEIVTCKLLLLRRPTVSQFFQFSFACRIFFLNHLAPPSKGELMPIRLLVSCFCRLRVYVISLNLIACIISIGTETSLLALAKGCLENEDLRPKKRRPRKR